MSAEQGDVRPEGREGMVTVYDSDDRYLGCMGREVWERLLAPVSEQGNVQLWREAEVLIRESLLDGTVGGDLSEVRYNRAIMALTALTTQIEERDKRIEELKRKKWGTFAEDYDEVFARAEKAERALAEAHRALEWYAERRNYAPAFGDRVPTDGIGMVGVRDSYDGDGPGSRARAALLPSEDTSDES